MHNVHGHMMRLRSWIQFQIQIFFHKPVVTGCLVEYVRRSPHAPIKNEQIETNYFSIDSVYHAWKKTIEPPYGTKSRSISASSFNVASSETGTEVKGQPGKTIEQEQEKFRDGQEFCAV